MGCDVHVYIDYDDKEAGEGGEIRTNSLARVFVSRNYWLFTLLAGVRGCSIQGQQPISQPKGLPERISWRVRSDAYLTVLDDAVEGNHSPGCCTRDEAERWGGRYTDEEKRYVHHPDWHSHSWLTVEEVDEVINRYSSLKERKQIWLQPDEPVPEGYTLVEQDWAGMKVACNNGEPVEVPLEIIAIRDMMRAVESAGHKCRMVLWFDN